MACQGPDFAAPEGAAFSLVWPKTKSNGPRRIQAATGPCFEVFEISTIDVDAGSDVVASFGARNRSIVPDFRKTRRSPLAGSSRAATSIGSKSINLPRWSHRSSIIQAAAAAFSWLSGPLLAFAYFATTM
jgi:hypothetical protein